MKIANSIQTKLISKLVPLTTHTPTHPIELSPKEIKHRIKNRKYDIIGEFNTIFIGVPKTACTSIRKALFPNHLLIPHHPTIKSYSLAIKPYTYKKAYKFCFVRNPFERLSSAYHYLLSDKCETKDKEFSKEIADFSCFEEFVEKWISKDNIYSWMHFVPQWDFVSIDNKLQMDFIGRYENLNADYEILREKYDGPKELGFERKTGIRNSGLTGLSKKAKEIVTEVYERDFTAFDYDTNPPC